MNEEDIKNLNEIIELCEAEINNNDENVTAILDLTDLKSLRNLINRNKEIEEDYTSVYLSGFYDGENKWKSKIKQKIEELDKEEQKLQNSISDEEREEYSDANISWELCDIEIRRRCYKELLEKRK